jgi:hypothetical protein
VRLQFFVFFFLQQKVGPYRAIRILNLTRLKRMAGDLDNVKTLPVIARWFVFDILKCDLQRDSLKEIFDKASAKYQSLARPSDLSPEDSFLFSRLGARNYQVYKAMVENASTPPQEACSLKNTNEAHSKSSPSQETSGFLELARPYQHLYSSTSNRTDKLDLMCSAIHEVKSLLREGKKMKIGGKTCKCYRQIYQYSKIVGCLYECFEGNKKVFLETYPSLALASFTCVKQKKHSLTA